MAREVKSYSHCEKLNRSSGKYEPYFPLKVVGLAYELGHKLVLQRGSDASGKANLTWTDVANVRVSGRLRVKEEERWRTACACTVRLARKDAELALALVNRQRAVLNRDLHLNLSFVDKQGDDSIFDFLGSFFRQPTYGCQGLVWVELKAFGPTTFTKNVAALQDPESKDGLPQRFAHERSVNRHLGAVLLVAAKVARSSEQWGKIDMYASLWVHDAGSWQDLVGATQKLGRGKTKKVPRPTMSEMFRNMETAWNEDGEPRLYLKHCLQVFGLSETETKQKMRSCNSFLASRGHPGRLAQEKLMGKSGCKPVVADKDTFRVLYDFF